MSKSFDVLWEDHSVFHKNIFHEMILWSFLRRLSDLLWRILIIFHEKILGPSIKRSPDILWKDPLTFCEKKTRIFYEKMLWSYKRRFSDEMRPVFYEVTVFFKKEKISSFGKYIKYQFGRTSQRKCYDFYRDNPKIQKTFIFFSF